MKPKLISTMMRQVAFGMMILTLGLILPLTSLGPVTSVFADEPVYNTAFITDAQLEDYNSMSVDQIRTFLTSHNSYFRQPIQDVDGETFDPPEVIAEASSQYQINPQVLLTTLQKESSGVTRTTRPSDTTMRFLMGCISSSTARQQLMCAAERFRAYHDQLTNTGSTVSGWRVGVPKTTQDGVSVTPATKAVAGQFTYTPYAGVQWGGNLPSVGGVYLFYYWWNRFGFGQNTISLAVTPPGYDDIGAVLSRPGLGYPWIQIQVADLANYNLLSQYDVVFINCTWDIQNSPQVTNALRQYVQNGGNLYVSDWAYVYIRDAFPGYINFPSNPKIGAAQQVVASIADSGLASYINPTSPPSTIDLNYNLGSWVVIDSVSADTTVHMRGSFSTYSSQLTNRPLVVSFRPYGSTGGKVVYTTFHNEAQQNDVEKKLLEYLILLPLTSTQQQAVAQAIATEGLNLLRVDVNTIDPGTTSPEFTYSYGGAVTDPRLAFALAWSGSGLRLSVYRPDGSLYQQVESSQSPIKIVILNAEVGNWKYQVTGVDVPYYNYPYAIGIGAEAVTKIYLPMIRR